MSSSWAVSSGTGDYMGALPPSQPPGQPPKPRIGLGTKMSLLLIPVLALSFLGSAWIIGGYFGPSAKTTGEVVSLNGSRPTVRYTVDGETYQVVTSEHGPQFSVGQQVLMCYNPRNPVQAQTCGSRVVATVFAVVGFPMLPVWVALIPWSIYKRGRMAWVIGQGHVVTATITGSRRLSIVHWGRTVLWRILCTWTDPATGKTHVFSSQYVWSKTDPVQVLVRHGATSVPVYTDPAKPGKNYYVHLERTDFTTYQ